MGNFNHTNVGDATALTQYLTASQAVNNVSQYLSSVSGADTITASGTFTPAAYSTGQVFSFIAAGTNTTAVTLNISGLGAKNLYKRTSGGLVALVAEDLISGQPYSVIYDGTQFVLEEKRPYSQGADIASASTINLDTATGDYAHVTGTTNIDTITLAQGEQRTIVFDGILTLTNGASLILPTAANITTVANDVAVFRGEASGVVRCVGYTRYDGTSLASSQTIARSYISGLTLSTAGSSTTMSIAAGQATDSTNAVTYSLAASISKTTSAWAVGTGNGGLDTGTIANSTWYYFYIIRRPDTGVVDVVFSTSSSAPTLPTNYTQYRYIGAGLTNGSGQWVKFTQVGDEFFWDTPVMDFNGAGSATASLLTCSVPRGRKVKAYFNVTAGGGGPIATYLSDPANADLAPSTGAVPLAQVNVTINAGGNASCWTNTSAQIRHRELGTNGLYFATLGWTDLRGKDL